MKPEKSSLEMYKFVGTSSVSLGLWNAMKGVAPPGPAELRVTSRVRTLSSWTLTASVFIHFITTRYSWFKHQTSFWSCCSTRGTMRPWDVRRCFVRRFHGRKRCCLESPAFAKHMNTYPRRMAAKTSAKAGYGVTDADCLTIISRFFLKHGWMHPVL